MFQTTKVWENKLLAIIFQMQVIVVMVLQTTCALSVKLE